MVDAVPERPAAPVGSEPQACSVKKCAVLSSGGTYVERVSAVTSISWVRPPFFRRTETERSPRSSAWPAVIGARSYGSPYSARASRYLARMELLAAMANDGPSMLGLLGGDDNRVPARVDLEEDLNLKAVVDRLELGAVLLFGQLVLLGLFTSLPVTVQVGVAVVAVVLLDVVDRKVIGRFLGAA